MFYDFFQEALNQASATISENDTVISHQRANLTQMENEIEALEVRLATKKEELAEAVGIQKNLRECLQTASGETTILEERSAQREKEAEEKIAGIEKRLKERDDEWRAALHEIEDLRASLETVKQEKAQETEENERLRLEIERLEGVVACGDELKTRVAGLNEELSKLQTKLDEAEAAHAVETLSLVDEVSALKCREISLKVSLR